MRNLLDYSGLKVFVIITILVLLLNEISTGLPSFILIYSVLLSIQFFLNFKISRFKNLYRLIPLLFYISLIIAAGINLEGESLNLPIFVAILIFLLPILLISLDLQSSIAKLLNKKTNVFVLMFMVFFYYPFGIWYFQKILNQISVRLYKVAE